MSRNRSDEVPYDRELIRSGGVSRTRGRGRAASAPREQRRGARSVRRRRSPFRAIGILFLLLLIAGGVGIFLLGSRAAAFNATVSTAPFPSTALFGALNGSDRVNVLMIGYGGGDHDGPFLADSIQVLSIDPETDTTTTIPIPRDLWIEGISEFSQNGKVNEVFAFGEAEAGLDEAGNRLAAVISDVTGNSSRTTTTTGWGECTAALAATARSTVTGMPWTNHAKPTTGRTTEAVTKSRMALNRR